MSDKRKVLVAKRKNEKNPKIFPEKIVQEDSHLKHGTKRTISVTPKKNIAKSKDKNCVRKRPTDSVQHEVSTKLFIKESASSSGECSNSEPGTPFIFKEEFLTQTNVFTTESPNPFAVGFQQTAVVSEEDMEWCPTDIEESKSTNDNTLNSQITSSLKPVCGCPMSDMAPSNIPFKQLLGAMPFAGLRCTDEPQQGRNRPKNCNGNEDDESVFFLVRKWIKC
ncbi:hypothetical protein TcasGA2_TC000062 [Tribolium castaneum]|uniref:Uncharacterized protein n=1 Tax=Tribolium castaneum TaxID=7070 RepID=D6WDA1_TRICA|nr:hypothetical protein TcasGA2_TC000062 [Tribolium castaneum]